MLLGTTRMLLGTTRISASKFFLRLTYRRDRPCRDPLKRDSGRYAITLITLLEVFNLPGEVARRRHENLALCRNAGGSWPWP